MAGDKLLSLEEIIKKFYEAEHNLTISFFWDGGYDLVLGDEANGIKEEHNFKYLEDLRDYLIEYHKQFLSWEKKK